MYYNYNYIILKGAGKMWRDDWTIGLRKSKNKKLKNKRKGRQNYKIYIEI